MKYANRLMSSYTLCQRDYHEVPINWASGVRRY